MGRYAKLGTLAIRWTAIGFFLLALVFLPFGFAGGMGAMMGGVANGGTPQMMQGLPPLWWGPSLLNVLMGTLLFALSERLGRWMGSGLDPGE